jgi:hypothetical protein
MLWVPGKLPSRANGAAWARVPTTRVPDFPVRSDPIRTCRLTNRSVNGAIREGWTSLFGLLDYWNSPKRAWLKLTCKQPSSLWAPLLARCLIIFIFLILFQPQTKAFQIGIHVY